MRRSVQRRAACAASWREGRPQFVDDPKGAVTSADSVLSQVMAARGYPMADFAQRAADHRAVMSPSPCEANQARRANPHSIHPAQRGVFGT